MPARAHIRAQTMWVAVMDLVCLVAGCLLGVFIRFDPSTRIDYTFHNIGNWFLLFSSILLANYVAGSYRIQYTFSRFNLVVTWIFSLLFATMIMAITSYAWMADPLGRGVLLMSILSYSVLSLTLKLLVYRSLFRGPAFVCRTVVFGTGKTALQMRDVIEKEYVLPRHKVVAYIAVKDGISDHMASVLDGVAVIESAADSIEEVIRSLGVNLIVIGLDHVADVLDYYPRLRRLRFDGIEVLTPNSVAEIYTGRTPLKMLDEEFLMQVSMESGLPVISQMKRLLDIVMSLIAILVFFPLMLLIACIIKISAPRSSVFYHQDRVGQFGVRFRLYKFRTMQEGAEAETGPVWAESNDSRITRIGRFLRRFRLDELPQFFNVLKGQMSVVGPRPERPEITVKLAEEIPFYHERENVLPGLTGWAQIRYPYGDNIEDARRKLEYDLYYIKTLSLSLDLQIILSTIRIVLLGMERDH